MLTHVFCRHKQEKTHRGPQKRYHNTIDRPKPSLIIIKIMILTITPTNLTVILSTLTNNQTPPMSKDHEIGHQQANLMESPCLTTPDMIAQNVMTK